MGVPQWVPRQALPGAPAGHRVIVPALPTNDPAHHSQRPAASPTASVGRARALADTLETPARPARPQPPKVVAAVQTPSPNTPPSSFELVCSRYQDWLLVDDVTAMRFAGSAYQQWIVAILASLGIASDAGLALQQDRFEWPLADASQFDTGPAAATHAVQAWLSRRLADSGAGNKPAINIVLMGEAAAQNLSVSDAIITPGERVVLGGEIGAGLVTHGSTKLWQQPLLKREFWQHLMLAQSNAQGPAR